MSFTDQQILWIMDSFHGFQQAFFLGCVVIAIGLAYFGRGD